MIKIERCQTKSTVVCLMDSVLVRLLKKKDLARMWSLFRKKKTNYEQKNLSEQVEFRYSFEESASKAY